MPLVSEKRKEFQEIEGMAPAKKEAMPPVVQYGMETHGDVRSPRQRREAKVEEMVSKFTTPQEHRDFQRRRASGYGKTRK